jgi:hypothetical protein
MKILVFWIYLDAGGGKYMDPMEGWSYHADPLPALDTYTRHTGAFFVVKETVCPLESIDAMSSLLTISLCASR